MDTPSRLKGMETFEVNAQALKSSLVTLDTPSRLKGMETQLDTCVWSDPLALDTPSRLKGIETIWRTYSQLLLSCLWIHLPV